MKKLNQKAFTHIELLLVVLTLFVVTIIGFSAYQKSENGSSSNPQANAAGYRYKTIWKSGYSSTTYGTNLYACKGPGHIYVYGNKNTSRKREVRISGPGGRIGATYTFNRIPKKYKFPFSQSTGVGFYLVSPSGYGTAYTLRLLPNCTG